MIYAKSLVLAGNSVVLFYIAWVAVTFVRLARRGMAGGPGTFLNPLVSPGFWICAIALAAGVLYLILKPS